MTALTTTQKKALAALLLGMFSSSVAYTVGFPIVGFMVQDWGIAKDDAEAGYYAGYLMGVFMFGRVVGSLPLGMLSDRIGRNPIMQISLLSSMVGSIGIGLTKSYSLAIVIRFLSGALNGSAAAGRTVVADLFPEQQAAAMSWYTSMWGVSQVIGPALGGFLSRPVEKYSIFANCNILRVHPYLLAMLFPTIACAISSLLVFLWLPETLNKKSTQQSKGGDNELDIKDDVEDRSLSQQPNTPTTTADECQSPTTVDDTAAMLDNDTKLKPLTKKRPWCYKQRESTGMVSIFFKKWAMFIILLYMAWSFQESSFNEVYPLWALARPQYHGLGWDSNKIGMSISIAAASLAVFSAAIQPKLMKMIGCLNFAKVAAWSILPIWWLFPLVGNLVGKGVMLWIALLLMLSAMKCLSLAVFTTCFVFMNNSVDNRHRGAMNGLGMMTGSILKGFGPSVATVVFAWSISPSREHHFPFNYHLTFLFVGAWAAVVAALLHLVPKKLEQPYEKQ